MIYVIITWIKPNEMSVVWKWSSPSSPKTTNTYRKEKLSKGIARVAYTFYYNKGGVVHCSGCRNALISVDAQTGKQPPYSDEAYHVLVSEEARQMSSFLYTFKDIKVHMYKYVIKR